MRKKWESWLQYGKHEYTKSGKRKRASYEMICGWVQEVWITLVLGESIVKGFQQNGYIQYTGDVDSLQSRLKETLKQQEVLHDLIQEVDEFLEEFRVLDINEDGEEANDDSETEDVVIEMDRNQNEDDEIEDEPNTSEVMDEDGNETDDDVDESDEQNDNDSDIDVE